MRAERGGGDGGGGGPPSGGGRDRADADRGVAATLLEDLDAVVAGALDAAAPGPLVLRALEEAPWEGAPPRVVAVGKAAVPMARAAVEGLGGRHAGGVVLAPKPGGGAGAGGEAAPEGLALHRGGHPLPDADGRAGARSVEEAARAAGREDGGVLLLLSGGGSALLTLPADGLELDDLRATTRLLLEAGADIARLNTVRKHLERLKGGGLARAAAPARLRALVLSDVVGDRLDVIASGPVSPDPTTYADALAAVDDLELRERLPGPVLAHLEAGAAGRRPETPGPEDEAFRGVDARIVGNVETALDGAAAAARERGYAVHRLGADLTGEASEVGRRLGRRAWRVRYGGDPVAPPACLLAGGETTVHVTGEGKGGRNQEVALGAALEIAGLEGVVVASVGTDGVDGPTDAAGARATPTTVERARRRGLEVADALSRNDAYPFFRALDDLVVTGPTGTNVMDVQVILVR